jgi:hypothetical protein
MKENNLYALTKLKLNEENNKPSKLNIGKNRDYNITKNRETCNN